MTTIDETPVTIDVGTAYGMAPGTYDRDLAEVGPGTPMGELLRRYWHPIGLSEDATDVPTQVRVLGEDLILYRDRQGKVGLMHPRCTHRGTSLLYARVDDDGIRCCYHGWAFDTEGRCTDQPCEPDNGKARDRFRQPWYPADERYGLIWAYLGPPEKKPLLPRYSTLENLGEGEQLFTDDKNIGSGRYFRGEVPFNWFQHFENILDAAHFLWLHMYHSGPQFGSRYGEFDLERQPWELLTKQTFDVTDTGVAGTRQYTIPDGRLLRTVTETVLPNIRGVSNPFGAPGPGDALGFVLPVDDTHFRIFTVLRSTDRTFYEKIAGLRPDGDPPPEKAQRFPGDWEAQGSQGEITLHSEEHLSTSDRGVRMLRRLFREQMQIVSEGGDPINVGFAPGDEYVDITCGQYLEDPAD